jgi:hypothetical protein
LTNQADGVGEYDRKTAYESNIGYTIPKDSNPKKGVSNHNLVVLVAHMYGFM